MLEDFRANVINYLHTVKQRIVKQIQKLAD